MRWFTPMHSMTAAKRAADQRIEGATEPMRMGISEATYARLRNPSQFHQAKTVQVKNRTSPVKIYMSESSAAELAAERPPATEPQKKAATK